MENKKEKSIDFMQILPSNDLQIRAYSLLQLIIKMEISKESAYKPENDLRKRNLENLKKQYYSLIDNLNH